MPSLGGRFFSQAEVERLGLASIGRDVLIHESVIIIDLQNVSIGDNSRIDAHTVIIGNGPVHIGQRVHVGAASYIAGGGGVSLEDFSGLSQGVRIYSVTDDYSGGAMTNPTVPSEYTQQLKGAVQIGRHAILGAGSVVLPGVVIGEGCAVGSLSLVNRSIEPWGIYVGTPARLIHNRKRDLLAMEQKFTEHYI